MTKTIAMNWSKSTKGTHVYSNSEPDAPVSTIYIKRNAMPDKTPAKITLTIDFDDE